MLNPDVVDAFLQVRQIEPVRFLSFIENCTLMNGPAQLINYLQLFQRFLTCEPYLAR